MEGKRVRAGREEGERKGHVCVAQAHAAATATTTTAATIQRPPFTHRSHSPLDNPHHPFMPATHLRPVAVALPVVVPGRARDLEPQVQPLPGPLVPQLLRLVQLRQRKGPRLGGVVSAEIRDLGNGHGAAPRRDRLRLPRRRHDLAVHVQRRQLLRARGCGARRQRQQHPHGDGRPAEAARVVPAVAALRETADVLLPRPLVVADIVVAELRSQGQVDPWPTGHVHRRAWMSAHSQPKMSKTLKLHQLDPCWPLFNWF